MITTINSQQLVDCIESIILFNKIGGNKEFEVDPTLENKMLTSEVKEYYKGALENDQVEVRDGIADIFVVLMGTAWKHGHLNRFVDDLKAVCESNLTKFCCTIEEAKASVEHYKDLGNEVHYHYVEEFKVFVIRDNRGKILKSINFKKPQL